MTKVYSINSNLDVEDCTATLVGNKYVEDTSRFRYPTFSDELRYPKKRPDGVKAPEIPSSLKFSVSSTQRLDQVDKLSVDTNQDILSNVVIEALQNVSELDCKIIPIQLIDEKNQEVCEGRFSCLLYNELCDCFDYETAEYRPDDFSRIHPEMLTERRKKKVRSIRKLALIRPESGFPPIFRLLAKAVRPLLVSEQGKDAITAAGITSLDFHLHGDFN